MKIENMSVGERVYLKTLDEVKLSKYYTPSKGLCGGAYFTDESMYYDTTVDSPYGGSLVTISEIYGDDVYYIKADGNGGYVSRHAFRKPTKEELEVMKR